MKTGRGMGEDCFNVLVWFFFTEQHSGPNDTLLFFLQFGFGFALGWLGFGYKISTSNERNVDISTASFFQCVCELLPLVDDEPFVFPFFFRFGFGMLRAGVVLATNKRRSPYNIFRIFEFRPVVLVWVCFGLAWFWLPSNIEVRLNFFFILCCGVGWGLVWVGLALAIRYQPRTEEVGQRCSILFYFNLFVRILLPVDDDFFIALFLRVWFWYALGWFGTGLRGFRAGLHCFCAGLRGFRPGLRGFRSGLRGFYAGLQGWASWFPC